MSCTGLFRGPEASLEYCVSSLVLMAVQETLCGDN